MWLDLNSHVMILSQFIHFLFYLANSTDGIVTVLNRQGQVLSEINIPYAPEITGLAFSRFEKLISLMIYIS